jgi:hypothetical protein
MIEIAKGNHLRAISPGREYLAVKEILSNSFSSFFGLSFLPQIYFSLVKK